MGQNAISAVRISIDMTTHTEPHADRLTVGDVLGVVVEKQSYRNVLYLLLAFPLGVIYFTLLTAGIAVGIGLVVVLIGIPILLAVVVCARPVAEFERQLANALLTVTIPRPTDAVAPQGSGLWPVLRSYLGASSTWKGLAFLYLKFWIGLLSFVLVVTTATVTLALIGAPLHYNDSSLVVSVFGWQIDTLSEAVVAVPVGVVVGIISLHLLNGVATLSGLVAKALLGGLPQHRKPTHKSLHTNQ